MWSVKRCFISTGVFFLVNCFSMFFCIFRRGIILGLEEVCLFKNFFWRVFEKGGFELEGFFWRGRRKVFQKGGMLSKRELFFF